MELIELKRTSLLLVQAGAAFRLLAVDDIMHLHDLRTAICQAFQLDPAVPWSFRDGTGQRVDAGLLVRDIASVIFQWGLWSLEVEVCDTFPYEPGVPSVQCVAGDGQLS